MKFLQKRAVAVAVMILAILAAVMIGQAKKPDTSIEPSTIIVGSYTYVYDHSGVMSDKTMEYIDAMNASLFAQTGGQILIQVVDSTGSQDIEQYAIDLGNKYQIGDVDRDNGLVLVLALENISSGGLVGDYWVEPGDGIYDYVNELDNMCRIYLEDDFAAGNYDAGVRKTFDAYIDWYEDQYYVTVKENYIPAVRDNFSTGGGYYTQTTGYVEASVGSIVWNLILVMFVLLIIWVIVDAIRWNRYRTRYMRPGMGIPTVTYYPVFWGRPRRRVVVVPHRPRTPPRPPAGGFGSGPNHRPPSGGFGGSTRSGGRSSFGGGGSFGGRSSASRNGGRSSFGGSSRSSGGRSSFGGGGSFGGSRGGGRMGGGRSGGRGR